MSIKTKKCQNLPRNFIPGYCLSNWFFPNMNRITEVKTHLHHSHVTGGILGYVHDFCNWRLRENKTEFVCCAHNFFGFHMYFLIQGFRVTACNTKDFTVGGSGLTRINFVNISSSTKFFDEVKYYQKSLAQLIKK